MTNEEFKLQIEAIKESLLANNRLVELSLEEHARTRGRIDDIVSDLRDGLREDIELVLKPVVDKLDGHSKKIDDHETRIRGLEKSGTKRDVMVGGGAAMLGTAAGMAMGGLYEAVKTLLKVKGGP